ncbi:MAG: hypothetical protein R3C03_07495 [Pirellulaceae bacterium]
MRVIDFPSRSPVTLATIEEPIYGWPIESLTNDVIRDLTFAECESMAAASAPIANSLDEQAIWLRNNGQLSSALENAIAHQAAFERNEQAGKALEAYLNLANIYSQQPVMEQSRSLFVEAAAAAKKFQDAGIEIAGDVAAIEREALYLDRRSAELLHSQNQLHAAMTILLSLDIHDTLPIWTHFNSQDDSVTTDYESDVAVALSHRGDLNALRSLAQECSNDSLSTLQAASSQASPLLGAALPLPQIPKWWQCILKDELECLKNQNLDHQRQQLMELVATKEKLVVQEVREVISSMQQHQQLLDINMRELESLRSSIEAAERAKDATPLDFETHLKQRQRQLQLTSDIVNELFSIQLDRVRLRRSQGLLGQSELVSQSAID